mmetsp:Transcript_48013/g.96692  ORF Transcript_48013/g.96692 Transcript_48013/m.96692 type:complete len:227 (+) Transcript_48013:63-743(+)
MPNWVTLFRMRDVGYTCHRKQASQTPSRFPSRLHLRHHPSAYRHHHHRFHRHVLAQGGANWLLAWPAVARVLAARGISVALVSRARTKAVAGGAWLTRRAPEWRLQQEQLTWVAHGGSVGPVARHCADMLPLPHLHCLDRPCRMGCCFCYFPRSRQLVACRWRGGVKCCHCREEAWAIHWPPQELQYFLFAPCRLFLLLANSLPAAAVVVAAAVVALAKECNAGGG